MHTKIVQFLWFFTCLLTYSPQHKSCSSCWQLYIGVFFLSPLFLCFFNLEFRNLLLSVPSVLSCVIFFSLSCPSFYSFLLFFLFPVLFSPSVYSLFLFCSPLLFSFQICYPFFSVFLLLYSVCFSLMFYYYSICFLSINLNLFRSLYLLLLCYLFCSSFCFHNTCPFWKRSNNTFFSVFHYFFHFFTFPLFPFCSFYASFFLCFYSFSFSVLFSSPLLYATPVLTIDLPLIFFHSYPPLPSFSHPFYLFFPYYYYYSFLSFSFCL